ncbi:MAG: serine/threonine-protein phosphatase [Gammaproteobacteria bacterium]|nr:serine/threonine-protein phosphatase [Gammaproteobacteria bacterium]
MMEHFFSIKCNAYGRTDVGRARQHNEDNVHMNRDHLFFMLADGMGGREEGDRASKIALGIVKNSLIKHFHQTNKKNNVEFVELEVATKAIQEANLIINHENKNNKQPDGRGMGTTIVGCWYLPDKKMSIIFHVGDSRAYSYDKQELAQITTDHSLLQLWKDKCFDGDKPSGNILTKALGPYNQLSPDVFLFPVNKGKRILLCSDGLSNMLNDEQILDVLIRNKKSVKATVKRLVLEANIAGGEDNISVILIDFS